MNKKVLPQHDIFLACKEVLDTTLKPLHYEELTRRGLRVLGVLESEVNWKKQIEDVREKMLERRWQQSVFYLGDPCYLGAVTHWFQRGFNLGEPIVIPTDVSIAIQGTYEALMRDNMVKKNPSASDSARMMAKAQGMQTEQPVKEWFKSNWPILYRPSDNDRQWTRPSDHDFKLKINGRAFGVDVSGPDRDGNHGNTSGKKPTDLHLICAPTEDNRAIEWLAFVRGSEYTKNLVPELCVSPLQLIVWLNCIQDGLPYDLLKSQSRLRKGRLSNY